MHQKLRTYLGGVILDIERKVQDGEIKNQFIRLLQIAKQIHSQAKQRKDGNPTKIYSVVHCQ